MVIQVQQSFHGSPEFHFRLPPHRTPRNPAAPLPRLADDVVAKVPAWLPTRSRFPDSKTLSTSAIARGTWYYRPSWLSARDARRHPATLDAAARWWPSNRELLTSVDALPNTFPADQESATGQVSSRYYCVQEYRKRNSTIMRLSAREVCTAWVCIRL